MRLLRTVLPQTALRGVRCEARSALENLARRLLQRCSAADLAIVDAGGRPGWWSEGLIQRLWLDPAERAGAPAEPAGPEAPAEHGGLGVPAAPAEHAGPIVPAEPRTPTTTRWTGSRLADQYFKKYRTELKQGVLDSGIPERVVFCWQSWRALCESPEKRAEVMPELADNLLSADRKASF